MLASASRASGASSSGSGETCGLGCDHGHVKLSPASEEAPRVEIFELEQHGVVAGPEKALNHQRDGIVGNLVGRQIEAVPKALEELTLAKDLAVDSEIVGAALGAPRLRDLARHDQQPLDHGSALMPTRKGDPQSCLQGRGIG